MPVIDYGQVFAIGLGGLMVSLDLRSGRRVWERDVGSGETPWLAGDWLFVLTGDMQAVGSEPQRRRGRLGNAAAALREREEAARPDPLGRSHPGRRPAGIRRPRPPRVALSPYTGKVLGQQDLPAAAAVAPVVADGTLYIVTDDATLLALR